LSNVLSDEESEHFNEIDIYNEDTFGSGAVGNYISLMCFKV